MASEDAPKSNSHIPSISLKTTLRWAAHTSQENENNCRSVSVHKVDRNEVRFGSAELIEGDWKAEALAETAMQV
jgi:hypothetical protein